MFLDEDFIKFHKNKVLLLEYFVQIKWLFFGEEGGVGGWKKEKIYSDLHFGYVLGS